MERYLLLLAFGVEFAGRYGEDKVSVLFVVDNFQRKTTQSEVFLFGVLAGILLPLLADRAS